MGKIWLFRFWPAWLWGLLIFFIVTLPPSSLPPTEQLNMPHFDKLVHFGLFLVLGVLMVWGYGKSGRLHSKQIVISLLVGIAYGGLTEYFQHCCLTERHGNVFDFYANAFGTVFGVFLMAFIKKCGR